MIVKEHIDLFERMAFANDWYDAVNGMPPWTYPFTYNGYCALLIKQAG